MRQFPSGTPYRRAPRHSKRVRDRARPVDPFQGASLASVTVTIGGRLRGSVGYRHDLLDHLGSDATGHVGGPTEPSFRDQSSPTTLDNPRVGPTPGPPQSIESARKDEPRRFRGVGRHPCHTGHKHGNHCWLLPSLRIAHAVPSVARSSSKSSGWPPKCPDRPKPGGNRARTSPRMAKQRRRDPRESGSRRELIEREQGTPCRTITSRMRTRIATSSFGAACSA